MSNRRLHDMKKKCLLLRVTTGINTHTARCLSRGLRHTGVISDNSHHGHIVTVRRQHRLRRHTLATFTILQSEHANIPRYVIVIGEYTPAEYELVANGVIAALVTRARIRRVRYGDTAAITSWRVKSVTVLLRDGDVTYCLRTLLTPFSGDGLHEQVCWSMLSVVKRSSTAALIDIIITNGEPRRHVVTKNTHTARHCYYVSETLLFAIVVIIGTRCREDARREPGDTIAAALV